MWNRDKVPLFCHKTGHQRSCYAFWSFQSPRVISVAYSAPRNSSAITKHIFGKSWSVYSAFHEDFPLSCEIGYRMQKSLLWKLAHRLIPCQYIFEGDMYRRFWICCHGKAVMQMHIIIYFRYTTLYFSLHQYCSNDSASLYHSIVI